MQNLLKLIASLEEQIKKLIASRNLPTVAGEKFYETAKLFLGKDASPQDVATDEFGCAESLNQISIAAFGEPVGGDLSTLRMYYALKNHKKFVQVTVPLRGDIILSPTGMGGKNNIKHGHVGLCMGNNEIASNDSKTGLFKVNYRMWDWTYRFQTLGGYPVLFYRRIA